MENHERFRMLAAIILLLSANIRTFQVYLAGFTWNYFVKLISWWSPYGIFIHIWLQVYIIVSYGILGFFLLFLKENKLLTFFCIITSFIKGTLGFLRLMNALIIYFSMDWFRISIFLADIIIVASCVHYYIKFTKMDNKGRINFIYINIVFVILIISIIIFRIFERLIL